ncbi:hypothetical protein H0N95_02780, partial [Candidatus Micrarchaeota archaeon]|nr:hypothetical protein [Candidatus Micrarchaeota archaeon]
MPEGEFYHKKKKDRYESTFNIEPPAKKPELLSKIEEKIKEDIIESTIAQRLKENPNYEATKGETELREYLAGKIAHEIAIDPKLREISKVN